MVKELKDTIKLMNSSDYKDRFRAEYYQTKIRYEKLHKTVIKYEAGTLNFTPSCSIELLKAQKRAMGEYLYNLEVRAEIEKIDLEGETIKEKIFEISQDGITLCSNNHSFTNLK